MATYAAKQKVLSRLAQSDLCSEMLYPDLHGGLANSDSGEWQAVEKKLIGFSLGIGALLLTALVIVNHVFPAMP
jgi:hypothetical protein